MRYDCDHPDFAGDYIEISDRWSRAQTGAIFEAAGEDDELFWQLLSAKVLSLNLSCVDAPAITEAGDLTPARADDLDLRLFRWLNQCWMAHLNRLSDLGKALGRQLYATYDTPTPTVTALASPNHS